jgi:ATP-dependent Clp protease ATP-binding subunit ClpC
MFERFDEPARKTLFLAFLAVREHGGTHIQPEHVVLGILSLEPSTIGRFASSVGAIEALRVRLDAGLPAGPKVPEEHEIPFSEATKDALQRAVIEADDLKNSHVQPEHLLLGVMVKTSGEAVDALHEAGVQIGAIRQFLQIPPEA